MRRKEARKRAGVVPILLAGCAGYLLGNAHIAAFRSDGPADLSASQIFSSQTFNSQGSASQAVALRFPLEWKDASLTTASLLRTAATKLHAPRSPAVAGTATDARETQLAMFDPQPMVPQAGLDTSHAGDVPDCVGGRCLAGTGDEGAVAGRIVGATGAAGHSACDAAGGVVAAANAGAEIRSRGSAARAEGRSRAAPARQRPAGLHPQRHADRQHQGAPASDAGPGADVACGRSRVTQHRLYASRSRRADAAFRRAARRKRRRSIRTPCKASNRPPYR